MKLDLNLIKAKLATRRDKISVDYGIEEPSEDPEVFAHQVVDAFNQPCMSNMLDRSIDDGEVFRAAVWSIGSSATVWTGFLRREPHLKEVLRGYDPVQVHEALGAGDVTVDGIASCLTSQYRRRDAGAIAKWAELLATTPKYYGIIHDVGAAIQDLRGDRELPDEKLLLCLVCYFANPLSRWPGEPRLSDRVRAIPPAERRFPGMLHPLASEFMRNLGWNGFKPDRHVVRLFNAWLGESLAQYDAEADELTSLIGQTSKPAREYMRYGLAGIDLTPPGTSYTEADNLVWLLGANIERSGAAPPGLEYVIS